MRRLEGFNKIGLIMGLISGLAALFLWAIGVSYRATAYGAFFVLFMMDGAYRFRNGGGIEGKDKWLSSRAGGVLAKSPVWLMGVVFIALIAGGFFEWLAATDPV